MVVYKPKLSLSTHPDSGTAPAWTTGCRSTASLQCVLILQGRKKMLKQHIFSRATRKFRLTSQINSPATNQRKHSHLHCFYPFISTVILYFLRSTVSLCLGHLLWHFYCALKGFASKIHTTEKYKTVISSLRANNT